MHHRHDFSWVSGVVSAFACAACGIGTEPGRAPNPWTDGSPGADACAALGLEGVTPAPFASAEGLLIDDFDQNRSAAICSNSAPNWEDPLVNNLGYCAECFNDCNGARGGRLDVRIVTEPERTLRCTGGVLELSFDISQDGGSCNPPPAPRAYAGFVELLVGNDLCPEDRGPFNLDGLNVLYLSFWVASSDGSDDWEIEAAIKDADNVQSPKLHVRQSGYLEESSYAGGWRRARIPLADLVTASESPNLRNLREINLTLTAGVTRADRGTIYVDEIAFTR